LLTAKAQSLPSPEICPGEYVAVLTDAHNPAQKGICADIRGNDVIVMLKSGSRMVARVEQLQKIDAKDYFESWWLHIFRDFFQRLRRICPSRHCSSDGHGAGGCSGCVASNGCDSHACESGDELPLLASLPSVKVPSMDAEHERCVSVLNMLVQQRSAKALCTVRDELVAHFSHEEDLMCKHGWGGDVNDRFSARKTHIEDHKRILESIECELRMRSPSISRQFIQTLIKDFEEHGARYDARYADFLSQSEVQ